MDKFSVRGCRLSSKYLTYFLNYDDSEIRGHLWSAKKENLIP